MRTRATTAALVAGLILLVGAVAVRVLVVPAVVRFPSHLDETYHYTGTYTSYVDDKTLQPLSPPKVSPFELDRHLRSVHSSFSTVVIHEDLTLHNGSRILRQQLQYVMDRRSMKFVKSPDSWAYVPANVTDRAGSYRIQLPLGTTANGTYYVWNNETATAAKLVDPSPLHHHPAAGVGVIDFHGNVDHEVTPAYRNWLAAQGFPMTITSAQVQAQLRAQGINVDAALKDVGSLLTPQESATLARTLGRPIALQYFYVYRGRVSIEPHTGSVMDVHTQSEGLEVKPDLSGVAALRPLFAKYSSIPSVKAVSDGLDRLTRQPPQTAALTKYTETDASSAEIGEDARAAIREMRLLKIWIPLGMVLLGGALLITALVLRRRRRRDTEISLVEEGDHERRSPNLVP